jgi:hypothetical protein
VRLWTPVRGELPANLALSSPLALSPTSAEVRGPRSRVGDLDSIPLVPLDLSDVRESGAFTLAVDTSGLGGATVLPTTAMVGVRVEPLVERLLEAVEVHALSPSGEPRAAVSPATIQVRLVGASTLVTALDLSLVRVSVSPESLRGLAVGEARRVPLAVEGVPPLIAAYLEVDAVTARRMGGSGVGGGS